MQKKSKISTKNKKIKDLYLDRPTSHGGWPDGHRGGYADKRPVNVQISSWLDSMGLLDDVEHGVLSESQLRHIIRKLLLSSHN